MALRSLASSALVLAAAGHLLGSASAKSQQQRCTLVTTSAGRTRLNGVFHAALRCGEAGLSYGTEEQCSFLEFDHVSLHADFPDRKIVLPAAELSGEAADGLGNVDTIVYLQTVDSVAGLGPRAASLMMQAAGEEVCVMVVTVDGDGQGMGKTSSAVSVETGVRGTVVRPAEALGADVPRVQLSSSSSGSDEVLRDIAKRASKSSSSVEVDGGIVTMVARRLAGAVKAITASDLARAPEKDVDQPPITHDGKAGTSAESINSGTATVAELAKATAAAGGATDKPVPWAAWLSLSVGAQLCGMLLLMGACVAVMRFTIVALPDALKAPAGHGPASHAPAPAGGNTASASSSSSASAATPLPSPSARVREDDLPPATPLSGAGAMPVETPHSAPSSRVLTRSPSRSRAVVREKDAAAAGAASSAASSSGSGSGGGSRGRRSPPLTASVSTDEEAIALVEAAAAGEEGKGDSSASSEKVKGDIELASPHQPSSASAGDASAPVAATPSIASAQRAALLKAVYIALPLLFIVGMNYALDISKVWPQLTKSREVGTDVFWALTLLLVLLASSFTMAGNDKDGETLMCVRQTEEAKGWMMFLFLV